MDHRKRIFASFILAGALLVPIGALAKTMPQDDRERHEQQRDRRVYDSQNRDYHNWDRQEDQRYRQWLDERHHAYVDYDRLDARQQREYWNWRHKRQGHEEHEEHENH
jgi:hypothetical protein